MKKPWLSFVCTLCVCLFNSVNLEAAVPTSVKGTIKTKDGEPLSFATIILNLQTDSLKTFGTISNEKGDFTLQVPAGSYFLKVNFLGYEPVSRSVDLNKNTDVGIITMVPAAVEVTGVVVQGHQITREADRFVMLLKDSPLTIGKSITEMLALAPGVWVQENDGTISINGKSGTQVMVNDRILHETKRDLIAYLSSLRAEDIQKIEVIPMTGADEDADKTGGMIKITLKKQRADGLNGSAYISASLSPTPLQTLYSMSPGVNLNYKNKKFSAYTSLSIGRNGFANMVTEQSEFFKTETTNTTATDIKRLHMDWGMARVGVLYDFDEKNQAGVEFSYNRSYWPGDIMSQTTQVSPQAQTDISSLFHDKRIADRWAVSVNYLHKLDTIGSTMKILLDYNNSQVENPQDYFSAYRGSQYFDTTYRSAINTKNLLYSALMDFKIVLNKNSSLKTGLKYTHNQMDNNTLYESLYNDVWGKLDPLSNNSSFTEDIGAIYLTYSIQFNNGIGFNAGLRGEYTQTSPWSSNVDKIENQKYFGLFPTAQLALPLSKTQKMILGYGRKIARPAFGSLNPYRFPISEVSFWEGNPKLQPAYTNDYSLSYVLKNKYNFTFGLLDTENDFGQISSPDSEDPDILITRPENLTRRIAYYLAVNLPVNATPWWTINMNLKGGHDRVKALGTLQTINTFQGNMSNNFSVAKIYSFSLDAFYRSPTLISNTRVSHNYQVNAALRVQMLQKKFTASIFFNNILHNKYVKIRVHDDSFAKYSTERWNFFQVGVSLRYNFRVGKDIKVKNVEAGNYDDRNRLP